MSLGLYLNTSLNGLSHRCYVPEDAVHGGMPVASSAGIASSHALRQRNLRSGLRGSTYKALALVFSVPTNGTNILWLLHVLLQVLCTIHHSVQ